MSPRQHVHIPLTEHPPLFEPFVLVNRHNHSDRVGRSYFQVTKGRRAQRGTATYLRSHSKWWDRDSSWVPRVPSKALCTCCKLVLAQQSFPDDAWFAQCRHSWKWIEIQPLGARCPARKQLSPILPCQNPAHRRGRRPRRVHSAWGQTSHSR